jgi:signal transduction histidine kinase
VLYSLHNVKSIHTYKNSKTHHTLADFAVIIIYFFTGLCFWGLGFAAYLHHRQGGDFALKNQLPWLAAFGFVCGAASWMDMFLVSGSLAGVEKTLDILRVSLHLMTGLILLRFGWGMLNELDPLPAWSIFIPGILIVPIAFVFTYAATTFVTPSPVEIPIEIWTRYLLYLPGSVLAGIGFLRLWYSQRKRGSYDVSNLMLGAGLAFLFEAVVVGLVVPAAPYGPASYYNYNRGLENAFVGEVLGTDRPYGLTTWLDYQSVMEVTGLPIEFWRLLSAVIVTFFVVKALDVFDTIRKRQLLELQQERDRAQEATIATQIQARKTAEAWTDTLVTTSRRIAELDNVDEILSFIVDDLRKLLDANFAGLAIMNQQSGNLELRCYSNSTTTELITDETVEVNNPLINKSMQSLVSHYSQGDESLDSFDGLCFFENQKGQAAAIVPLKLDKVAIGTLWVARFEENHFSETDQIYLESMSDQVVIAIQHGLMTSQLQSLSITEERARIAREMHDGLAQVLGYLNLQVQTLDTLLKQGKPDQLRMELAQMRQSVQIANADVRENILSLRTTLSRDKGLELAVKEYLDEFGIQTGIDTYFTYKVDGALDLASVAEVQLVCILQEALANVRKHAKATQVKVAIMKDDNKDDVGIIMRVRDNGIGISLSGSKRRFGLQTMHERAESVGGTFSIKTNDDGGTQIECRLPCLQQERLQKQSVVIG